MAKPPEASGAAAAGFSPVDQDLINRATWQRPDTVDSYRRLHGWTDPGEQAAVQHVVPEVCGQPILDLGVGAGRTTELLLPVSHDYLGVDYTPQMVAACRATFPGTRFAHMDARDLHELPAGHYALALFSFNGIDSVGLADRARVLREVHRVLRPGGVFILSAHNRHGPGTREKPGLVRPSGASPLRLGWRLLRGAAALPRALRNHLRLRGANQVHTEWAVMNCGTHDFGLVVLYTTLAEQKRQLEQAGYVLEAVYDNLTGAPVTEASDTRDAWWFHYVARKPLRH
jgi:SAM-dependent methyltransferase